MWTKCWPAALWPTRDTLSEEEMTLRLRVVITAAVATLAVGVAGCTPGARWQSGDASGGPSGSAAIDWRSCASEARRISPTVPDGATIQCGTVSVPQDWNKPKDGKTFDLAVMRIRASDQSDRIGTILLNPGGPGGSGYEFTAHLASRVGGLLRRFDILGFDPRGVGKSAPVKCIADADLDASFGYEPDPVSDASFQGLVALARRIGEGCGAKFPDTLGLFSTEQAARDMDAIRAALGEEKLNYLGFSYGTLLGAVYANLFPQRIRAMVLDGAVDPQQGPIEGSEGQAKGFERAFTNFTNWCRQNSRSCPIAPDARKAVTDAIDTARRAPVRRGDRAATAGWVLYAVIASLYSEQAWPILARAISDLNDGDANIAFLLADSYAERDDDGHFSTLFDANNAVNCADSEQYPSVEDIRALQADWRKKYPLFGAPLAVGMLNCSVWPAKKDPYPVGPAAGSVPIVVVGTTGDPATPYESTAKLASLLGTGTVVTWEGEGHTAYPETSCIRNAVERYFIEGEKPTLGLTCPAR
jgi:pimeloyl-ACP methyl ester carboxylesterase